MSSFDAWDSRDQDSAGWSEGNGISICIAYQSAAHEGFWLQLKLLI